MKEGSAGKKKWGAEVAKRDGEKEGIIYEIAAGFQRLKEHEENGDKDEGKGELRLKLKQVGETKSQWRLDGVIGIRGRDEFGFSQALVSQQEYNIGKAKKEWITVF